MNTFFQNARRLAVRTALVPAAVIAFAACDDDDATGPQITEDIVDIASSAPDVSTLAAAISAAGLTDALRGDGPFTVFAPVNSAFANLPAGELDRLLESANQPELQEILQFHVVPGEFFAADLAEGATLNTLVTGESLTISLDGGATVNGVDIIQTDIGAANGVIHLIDEVLLPPRPSIADQAAANADLSTLAVALDAAGLDATLAGDGPFTVFAPVNAAFDDLGSDVVASLLELGNADLLSKVLTYHVVPGAAVYSGELTDGQTVTTAQGEDLTIGVDGSLVTVNGIPVTTANVRASNGVIHLVDGVLTPELDIVETAIVTPETQTLVDAVVAGDLATTLKGEGPFTVFAPVNAAFEALGPFTLESLLDPENQALLQRILTYHVVAGEVLSTDLSNGAVATVEGGEVTINIDGAAPTVNGAEVVAADIQVGNGVIHLVDGVLFPELDIIETATITAETATLTAAVAAGGLVETLKGEGPFTVFAPVNEAFEALGTDKLEVLLAPENQALLQKVLTYHVVSGEVFSDDLANGTVTTVQGSDVTINVDGQAPTVNGATVVAADIPVGNGVIHLIDGVLTENLDIVDVATVNGFSTLVDLVDQQGLTTTLRSENMGDGFTVFAPTDDAFAALNSVPSGETLTEILLYHVVPSAVESTALSDGLVVTSANTAGDTFTVNIDGSSVTITDGTGATVNVTVTDVPAANGVIHVIDGVKLPGS